MMILSVFPGLGLLDRAFESEGFCVVRGPDVIWGGDVRSFHPPAGVFDGVIGGDPCQSHSRLANLVRAKGLEPSFPDMSPEFERIVTEARPAWFLRENVPAAPGIKPDGYVMHSFLIDNASLLGDDGTPQDQTRKRRIWFGVRDGDPVDLRRWIDFAAFELPNAGAVCGDARSVPVKFGGSGKVKHSTVTARHPAEIGTTGGHRGSPGRYTIAQMLELQGVPPDFLDHCPFTANAKRKAIGNGVPQALGRALARAVLEESRMRANAAIAMTQPLAG